MSAAAQDVVTAKTCTGVVKYGTGFAVDYSKNGTYDHTGSWDICSYKQGNTDVDSKSKTEIKLFNLYANPNGKPDAVSFELQFTGAKRYDVYLVGRGNPSRHVRLIYFEFSRVKDGLVNVAVGGLNNFWSSVTTDDGKNKTSKMETSNILPGVYYAKVVLNSNEQFSKTSRDVTLKGTAAAPPTGPAVGAGTQPLNLITTCEPMKDIPAVPNYDHTGSWRLCSVTNGTEAYARPLRITEFILMPSVKNGSLTPYAVTFQLLFEGANKYEVYLIDPKKNATEVRLKWTDFKQPTDGALSITIGGLQSYTSMRRNIQTGVVENGFRNTIAPGKYKARAYVYGKTDSEVVSMTSSNEIDILAAPEKPTRYMDYNNAG